MSTHAQTLVDLETKFWQSIVDDDPDTATRMLAEPAFMVSPHGTMKFDRAGYRKMATQGSQVLTSFELSDMDVVFPNDDTAVLAYHVKQAVAPRGKKDETTVEEMNDSSTWVRDGTHWRCVMHTETPAAA